MKELDTKRSRLNIVFCAYREWALESITKVTETVDINIVDILRSPEEFNAFFSVEQDIDCVVLVGWSWIIEETYLQKYMFVGMHPSDLPNYRGGSPIQHQIIDGLSETKISLMSISATGIDAGDIWEKEYWDLSGATMDVILGNLSLATSKVLIRFFENFGNIVPQKQDLSNSKVYKRRKPIDSKMTWNELKEMNLEEIYNFIRALSDPYPNAYVEDEDGNRLLFKCVEYVKRDK